MVDNERNVKGFKVSNPDWTYEGFNLKWANLFEEDVKPECCDRGFHFCTKASDLFQNYYKFGQAMVQKLEALVDLADTPFR